MARFAHKIRRQRTSQEAGFTLVELMISLTVVSVAIAAAFAMAFSLMNGFRDNRSAVQVEATSRTVLDIIATGVRSASPGLTTGLVWDVCTGGDITTLEVVNSSTGSDELRVIHALGGALASITSAQNALSTGSLTVDDTSDFETNVFVPAIIIDPFNKKGHLLEVSATSATTFDTRNPTVGGATCATNDVGVENYTAGSFIVRAVHMHYYVDPPFLMVEPTGVGVDGDGDGVLDTAVVMAEGIEDMQIAVGVESGADDTTLTEIGAVANDDEWFYNVAGEAAPATVDGLRWRALRISIVGFTPRDRKDDTTRLRPALEDRPVAGTGDAFRRRAFSTTVDLRNLRN
jgi:prepilin-type N-terminal cleavage/methylation domain-containing protein